MRATDYERILEILISVVNSMVFLSVILEKKVISPKQRQVKVFLTSFFSGFLSKWQ